MGRIRSALPQIEEHLETGFADTDGRLHRVAATARGGGEQLWWRPGLAEEYARRETDAMRELLLPGVDDLALRYPDRLYLLAHEYPPPLLPGTNGGRQR